MKYRRSLGAVLALLVTVGPVGADGVDPADKRLTILHTNGLLGNVNSHPYLGQDRGGMDRLVHCLRELGGAEAIIVDGGDAFGPHPMAQFDGGRGMAQLMDLAGYTAMVPGNHDLNYGPDTLRARAATVRFSLLAANVSYPSMEEPVFQSHVIVVRQGVRVLLTGLVSPGVAQTVHRLRAMDMRIAPPVEALQKVFDGVQRGPDYDVAVVLTHMPPLESLMLARSFPEVGLFVAGDNPQEPVPGGSMHVIKLASGARVVSTPERAPFVGRVELHLGPRAQGGMEILSVDTDLVAVDESVDPDPEMLARIALLDQAYARDRQAILATIDGAIEDGPQFVCDLLRHAGRTEVAVINRGALRPVVLTGALRKVKVDSLIRFDDVLVRFEVTGGQLQKLVASAKARPRAGQQLLFSGFDPKTGRVNGIPTEATETYSATTTAFLAGGGDQYLPPATIEQAHIDTLSLSSLVTGFLQRHKDPAGALRRRHTGETVWKATSKVTNSLSLTGVDGDAGNYPGVTSLRGKDALAWNTQGHARATRLSRVGTASIEIRAAFGQIREGSAGGFREATDRLDAETAYTWRRAGPAPFVSLFLSSVWTGPEVGDRPLRARGSAGLHRALGRYGALRLGVSWEHDVAARRGEFGLELSPVYKRTLAGGSGFSSSAKIFAGATDRRTISLQQYNSFVVRLKDNLHATVDANLFLHRDADVGRTGTKSEVQMGLTYMLAGRRAR